MATTPHVSRRSFLSTVSVTALVGNAVVASAVSAAPSENPDATLIALCTEWEALRKEFWTACNAKDDAEAAAYDKHVHLGIPDVWGEVHADAAYLEAERRTRENVDRSHALFQEIAQTRAVTQEGIMAKAKVTLGECLEGIDAELVESTEGVVPGYMAVSLVRDLLEISKQRGEA